MQLFLWTKRIRYGEPLNGWEIDAHIYKPYRKEDLMFFSLLLTLAGVANVNPENRPPDTGP